MHNGFKQAMFKNRQEAAMLLTKRLKKYRNKDGIVLAVPRGGVPVGYEIAKALGLPLEVILSKKLGHPHNPEYAIGSVTLNEIVLNDDVTDVPADYIRKETEKIREILEERYRLFHGNRKPADLENKTVIIVDDGIATGSTILASVQAVKNSKPGKIIVAVPVSPFDSARRLERTVDEFICLLIPDDFYAVGQFYYDFKQVSDEEAIQLLHEANENAKAA